MLEVIHIDKVIIIILEDDILENIFKGGKQIGVDDILDLRKTNLEITKGEPYAVIIQAEELTSFSKEARELTASKEFKGNTVAKAIIFEGLGQRIIANFYMRVNKPYIKTKVFSERHKGLEWLREEMNAYFKQHPSLKSEL